MELPCADYADCQRCVLASETIQRQRYSRFPRRHLLEGGQLQLWLGREELRGKSLRIRGSFRRNHSCLSKKPLFERRYRSSPLRRTKSAECFAGRDESETECPSLQ